MTLFVSSKSIGSFALRVIFCILPERQAHTQAFKHMHTQSQTMQIYRHMHDDTHPRVFIASLQIYSGLTFFLGKVALEKVSLDANTRKGGHFETLGKRLFIGPLALATFLLVLAGDAFSTPLRSNISNAKYKFRSTHTHVKTLGKLLFIRSDWRLRNFLATPSKRCIRRPSTPESRCWAPTFFYL